LQIRATIAFLLFSLAITATGSDLERAGIPFIINYNKSAYNANTQNWCIVQDDNFKMWFGNLGVVLWFDGEVWGQVSIPNGSVVRSLGLISGNRVMAGAFADFGTIEQDVRGNYHFHSWIDKVPARYRDFTDVWKIIELNNRIYVQTIERILVFREDVFERTITPERSFRFSFTSNGLYYVEDVGTGLKTLSNDQLKLVDAGDFFSRHEVWMISHLDGKLLAGTQNDGLFIYESGEWKSWNTQVNRHLIKYSLYCATETTNGDYIFGTVSNGIIVSDKQGNVIKNINKDSGLQNNTVLSIALDMENNLWLGLDRGIDYLKISSPFSQLAGRGSLGSGYASVIHEGNLYMGTNTGAYVLIEKEGSFDYETVENTIGQVWSFFENQGRLYCLHHNGIFEIAGNNARSVSDIKGCWKIVSIPGKPDRFILGTYSGIYLLSFNDGNINTVRLEGFQESSRVLEFDGTGSLWISHGYKGVFRLQFEDEFSKIRNISFYDDSRGLPAAVNNEVVRINGQIHFATVDGIYTFNSVTGLMERNQFYNNIFRTDQQITKLIQDKLGRIFIFSAGEMSVFVLERDSLVFRNSEIFKPLSNTFIPAFENIFLVDNDLSIIGFEEGFYIFNRGNISFNKGRIPVSIRKLYTFTHYANTRTELAETDFLAGPIKIPYNQNSLSIELGIPLFETPGNISISYAFNNRDYSMPSGIRTIELNALREGNYEIEIIVSDDTGRYSDGTVYLNFEILAPWFRSWYAYLVYIILFAILSVVVVLMIKTNIKRIQRREKLLQERKMLQKNIELQKKAEIAEQNLIMLKNDQLINENRLKTQQIANSTMELVQKNKMLLDVRERLMEVKKVNDIEIRNAILKDILKKIDRDLNNEENWVIFEKNFDEIHENFLNRLKSEHKNLTARDLRLCAYLRMNLSSKEIAPLLRISVRSVEISRYRLRTKMNLPHNKNLTTYLSSF
jgi:DNA-binding CsgD family transcriptional regulator